VNTLLCVAIQSPQRIYGWLLLGEKIGVQQFSEEDEALAQTLAAQVGRIYENGSLFDGSSNTHSDSKPKYSSASSRRKKSNS
jgi:hypothetical protein